MRRTGLLLLCVLFVTAGCTLLQPKKEAEPASLTVLATVVSRPALDRAVLDAGRKTVTAEPVLPLVQDHSGATVASLSAEHGVLQLSGDARDLQIGDKVEKAIKRKDE